MLQIKEPNNSTFGKTIKTNLKASTSASPDSVSSTYAGLQTNSWDLRWLVKCPNSHMARPGLEVKEAFVRLHLTSGSWVKGHFMLLLQPSSEIWRTQPSTASLGLLGQNRGCPSSPEPGRDTCDSEQSPPLIPGDHATQQLFLGERAGRPLLLEGLCD